MTADVPRPAVTAAALAAVGAATFGIRLWGAPNLLDNEYRVGATVLDVLQHGNWLCPHDVLGNTDKPPMLTWLAALASLPGHRVTPATIYLPTAVATVVTAWIVFAAARRWLGTRPAFFGALAYLLSHTASQQMATARWDGLFTLGVTATAMLAFRAWLAGEGWTAAWLAGAAAALTKGPLGLLLAGFGLLAVPWERRSGRPRGLTGSHALGIVAFLTLTLGWFLLAYRQVGPHLVDDMIRDELMGHVVEHRLGYRFAKPIGDFVADLFPWSLFAIWGCYRVVVAPDSEDDARRFERFLFCWLVGGLALFSASPHNQARLLSPMMPAAAMIAGREVDRLVRRLGWSPVAFAGTAVVVALAAFGVEYHRLAYRKPEVQRTLAILGVADGVRDAVGETFPLAYVEGTPFALQLALDTMYPTVSLEDAAALLRGDAAAFIVLERPAALRTLLGPDAPPLYEIRRASEHGVPFLYLVGNRPRLDRDEPVATRVGRLGVTLSGAGLASAWDEHITVAPGPAPGAVVIDNLGAAPLRVVVRLPDGDRARMLDPAGRWTLDVARASRVAAGGA